MIKIIGWSLSNGMNVEETSLAAWKMAIKNRSIEKGLLFYSDRGVQYPSKKFANVLDSYKMITRSMSRKGNCLDNALAESILRLLKQNRFMEINLYQKNK
jgi:putative transposase